MEIFCKVIGCGVSLGEKYGRRSICDDCRKKRQKEQSRINGIKYRARKAGLEPQLVYETNCLHCNVVLAPRINRKWCPSCKSQRERDSIKKATKEWSERQKLEPDTKKNTRIKRDHFTDKACDSGYF